MRSVLVISMIPLLGGVAACETRPATPSPSPSRLASSSSPARSPTPPPSPDALVDHDLAPLGVAWAGWWIKGPARARLEPSGTFPDASAIRWKTGGLGAMGFTPRAIDFKRVKHDLAVTGETITHESADELGASLTIGSTTLQCFYVNRKVGKVAVGCWTVACVRTDAELARAHAICDSLTLR